MLVKGQKNPTFGRSWKMSPQRVRTGESLSAAFEAQGGFRADLSPLPLLAGERSGQLEDVLSRYRCFPAYFSLVSQKADGFPALPLPA